MNVEKLKQVIEDEQYDEYMDEEGYSDPWEIIKDLIYELECFENASNSG